MTSLAESITIRAHLTMRAVNTGKPHNRQNSADRRAAMADRLGPYSGESLPLRGIRRNDLQSVADNNLRYPQSIATP